MQSKTLLWVLFNWLHASDKHIHTQARLLLGTFSVVFGLLKASGLKLHSPRIAVLHVFHTGRLPADYLDQMCSIF